MSGTLYLGTSGFAYAPWMNGVFYPPGLKPAERLSYYASVFTAVEINYTFRRFPTPELLAGWCAQTPLGFRFVLKANSRITHTKRLKNTRADVERFALLAAGLGDRQGPILFKCPEDTPYDADVMRTFLAELPPDMGAVMDIRDPSWLTARPLFAEHGVALCITDDDEHDAAPEARDWEPFGYLRLRKATYSDAQLAAWAERIAGAQSAGRDVHCFFRHEDTGAGPRMAIRLRELLGD